MRAFIIENFGGLEVLKESEVETPIPSRNEVLIKVAFSGMNPVDWKIQEGLLKERLPHKFPIILGWDVSGVVVQKGEGVTSLEEGDEVMAYCRKPVVHQGSLAEFIVLEAQFVVKKPKNLSFAESASLPLVSLTAWQALFEEAQVKPKEVVLIQGGAGGVGGVAIQLAKMKGCFVITTTSSQNTSYVKSLGADKVIDYKKTPFAEEILKDFKEGIDVVFDCVGGKTLRDSLLVLKKGGRLVSIVERLDPSIGEERGIKIGYTFVRPDGKMLEEIGTLFEKGLLKVAAIEEMSFQDVSKALTKLKGGHTKGKIVLKNLY
jgi:NADPH2:quinone reductase